LELKERDLLEIDFNKTKSYGNKILLLNTSVSNPWAIINVSEKGIIEYLKKRVTFKEINDKFKNYERQSLKDFLTYLYDSGILKVSGNSKFGNKLSIDRSFTSVVIKVTKLCNLKCLYCYSPKEIGNEVSIMDYGTLRKIIVSFEDIQSNLPKFILHGGEPLLRFDYIEKIYKELNKGSLKNRIDFNIQSNGTIMPTKVLKFLKNNQPNVSFGFSMDGYPEINDKIRLEGKDIGPSSQILKNLKSLQKNKIFPGVLVVLSSKNLHHIEEIFDFFIEHGITSFSTLPFFPSGRGKQQTELSIKPQDYFVAMQKLFYKIYKHNLKNKKRAMERTISTLLRHILTPFRDYMCMRMPCGAGLNTLAFDCNGDVYPCDDFLGQDKFLLGNIRESNLHKILSNSKPQIAPLTERSFSSVGCKDCAWQGICGGGCPGTNLAFYNTLNHKDYFCEFKKKFINFLFELIANEKIDMSVLYAQ